MRSLFTSMKISGEILPDVTLISSIALRKGFGSDNTDISVGQNRKFF